MPWLHRKTGYAVTRIKLAMEYPMSAVCAKMTKVLKILLPSIGCIFFTVMVLATMTEGYYIGSGAGLLLAAILLWVTIEQIVEEKMSKRDDDENKQSDADRHAPKLSRNTVDKIKSDNILKKEFPNGLGADDGSDDSTR